MRALDNIEALADVGGESRRVAGDDAELFAAVEQVVENLVAEQAGGSGDDDHRSSFRSGLALIHTELYLRYTQFANLTR